MDQDFLSKEKWVISDIVTPVSHLSPNSLAAIRHEIQRQERIHWFLGLKQAENIINDREGALIVNQIQFRKGQRELNRKERELESLLQRSSQRLSVPIAEQEYQENLSDEIAEQKLQIERQLKPMVRDCQMELETAQTERSRILAEHPEVLELSFHEIQETLSPAALEAKQIHYMAAATWASNHQLPEGVGQTLFDIAPGPERERVIQQMLSKVSEIQTALIPQQIAQVVGQFDIENQSGFYELCVTLLKESPDRRKYLVDQALQSSTRSSVLLNHGSH